MLGCCYHPAQAVSNHAFENDINPQPVELIRQIQRVGVHAVGSEHLGAYRDNFSVHALEV